MKNLFIIFIALTFSSAVIAIPNINCAGGVDEGVIHCGAGNNTPTHLCRNASGQWGGTVICGDADPSTAEPMTVSACCSSLGLPPPTNPVAQPVRDTPVGTNKPKRIKKKFNTLKNDSSM